MSRSRLPALAALLFIAVAGFLAASIASAQGPGHCKHHACTTSTTATTTAPTTTDVTTTSPPPPPSDCTKTLAAGGDLQGFASSLVAGDVGCLRGGSYSSSTLIDFTGTGPKTLEGYPGETAVLNGGGVSVSGSSLTVRDFEVDDTPSHGIEVSGSGNRVEHMTVRRSGGSNILLHTDACNTTVTRNYLTDAGYGTTSNQYHGIYVEGCFETVTNNLTVHPSGYGIHVYDASDHDIVVAENTAVNSATRAGFVVQVAGNNVKLVNNIAYGNVTGGFVLRQCGSGCVFDHLLGSNNGDATCVYDGSIAPGTATNCVTADPQFSDSMFHLSATSPAVDWSNPAFVFSPELDGVTRPQGAAADSSAYER